MGIQYLSDQALLVTLPKEPHLGNDIEIAIRLTSGSGARDVIVDCDGGPLEWISNPSTSGIDGGS